MNYLRNDFFRRMILLACVIILAGGCVITDSGCSQNYTAQKQMTLSGQCRTAEKIVSSLTHTDLTITGAETDQCTVVANITVHAESQQIADEVCELIGLQALDGDPSMTVAIVKPDIYKNKYSVSAKMEITAPLDKELDFATTHGDCRITNFQNAVSIRSTHGDFHLEQITGNIKAVSTHGDIEINNATNEAVDINTTHGEISLTTVGTKTVNLQTSHDPIRMQQVSADSITLNTTHDPIRLTECKAANANLRTSHAQITGDLHETHSLTANTTHGSINLTCINDANPQIKADLGTTHANITFTPPTNFAGNVHLSTTHGHINTDRALTVQGTVSEDNMNGSIGQGEGSVRMHSTHGNLNLK